MYEELELSSVGHIHNDLRLIPIVTGVFIGI
jgi:hypothetical protein